MSIGQEQPPRFSKEQVQPESFAVDWKDDFVWHRDLSEDGQKLYEVLLGEAGDRDTLPKIAEEDGYDLDKTLAELRGQGILDEDNPLRIRLK